MATDTDVEIARRIFGYLVVSDPQSGEQMLKGVNGNYIEIPKWSTDTTAAHQIIIHFQKKGLVCRINNDVQPDGVVWTAGFCRPTDDDYDITTAGSLAMAVCTAALHLVKNT